MKNHHLSTLEKREALMRTYIQLTQTESCEIFAMREANKNPTDILKKDIITSKVILHEVAESIDPTTTMISLIFGIQGHKG